MSSMNAAFPGIYPWGVCWICRKGRAGDLAVVVMSATLEISGLREYMGGSCRVLEAQGRQYPVEVVYRSLPPGQ